MVKNFIGAAMILIGIVAMCKGWLSGVLVGGCGLLLIYLEDDDTKGGPGEVAWF